MFPHEHFGTVENPRRRRAFRDLDAVVRKRTMDQVPPLTWNLRRKTPGFEHFPLQPPWFGGFPVVLQALPSPDSSVSRRSFLGLPPSTRCF